MRLTWNRTLLLALCLSLPSPARGDIFVLNNGDRLEGKLARETTETYTLNHPSAGEITLAKKGVKEILADASKQPSLDHDTRRKGDLIWDRKAGFNYALSSGNTDTRSIGGEVLVNRNRLWIDEWTFKGSAREEEANREGVAQKADASLRYAYTFWKKFYNFYRFGAEHDYFQGVKLRLFPITGFGYWFMDSRRQKMLVETGIGYEYEFLRPDDRAGRPLLQERFYFSRKLNDFTEAGTDLYYFPQLNDFGYYRFQGEGFVNFLLTDRFSLKFKLEDQYRSRPVMQARKNDLRLTTGIEYKF